MHNIKYYKGIASKYTLKLILIDTFKSINQKNITSCSVIFY